MRSLAMIVMSCLAASCCMVGPNYKRPQIQPPPVFRGVDLAAGQEPHREQRTAPDDASLSNLKWFDLFRDDALTSLVTAALKGNFDLRIAAERVLQARSQLHITRSNLFPDVDASGSYQGSRASLVGANRAVRADLDPEVNYGQVGFSLGWELDVWGRVRRLTESSLAQYLATEQGRRGVINTLIADVTDTYLGLRTFDRELEIAKRTRDTAEESLRLTTVRRESGVATGLDIRQAEQLLFLATARIARAERNIAQTENALTLLTGQLPGDVPRGLALEAFQAPASVPAGLPSSLLERRPDIRQAEQELISANAEIGVAKADYFPRIGLTGFYGGQSRALSDLLTAPARVWTAGAGAVAPIFNAGRTRAIVSVAESLQREALVNYERTIYTAFREVSDALAGYSKTREERTQQERLVETLRDSTRLSTSRYLGGIDSYLQVLDAQRNLFQGELDLALLRQQELAFVVQIYRALGGGWDPSMKGVGE